MLDEDRNSVVRESFNIRVAKRSKDFNLNGSTMQAEWLQERLPKQTLYAKVNPKKKLGDHGQDCLIRSRILAGTVWDFVQANCTLCYCIEKCGGLIWNCCLRNLQGKAGEEKRRSKSINKRCRFFSYFLVAPETKFELKSMKLTQVAINTSQT